MFVSNLKQVYRLCDSMIIRTIRQRRITPNPGLDKRATVFQKEGLQFDDDVEEYIESSEGNFMQAGQAYRDHVKQTRLNKDKLRHQIVYQKYFKENMPNLLTWSEKEQIRHLNSEEPEEWTPERIAESFPVTTYAAKQLLKFVWKPASEERIARHDASALRNWRELKEGTLEVPTELRERFLKFSNRNIPPLRKSSIKIDVTPPENIGEFQAIINRCAKKEDVSYKSHKPDERVNNEDIGNTENEKHENRKRITLEELTKKIKSRMGTGKVDIADELIVQNTLKPKDEPNSIAEINMLDVYNEKPLTTFKKELTELHIKQYPERIRIPKNAWKKGATYKVDDCFYDDDGRFLYRVIGI